MTDPSSSESSEKVEGIHSPLKLQLPDNNNTIPVKPVSDKCITNESKSISDQYQIVQVEEFVHVSDEASPNKSDSDPAKECNVPVVTETPIEDPIAIVSTTVMTPTERPVLIDIPSPVETFDEVSTLTDDTTTAETPVEGSSNTSVGTPAKTLIETDVPSVIKTPTEGPVITDISPVKTLVEGSVSDYTHILDTVVVSDIQIAEEDKELSGDANDDLLNEVEISLLDEDASAVAIQLEKLSLRMNKYEEQMKRQNQEITVLKEKLKERDEEIEMLQTRNQDPSVKNNRVKDKDKELQNMKQEFNKSRSLVGDLQMSVKQIHNQMKSMAKNTFDFDDRLTDLEKLSPKMGVFEWRLENYAYHSQSSEYLMSPEFYTHLNGYCCYMSVQWFGSKNGRLGLYLHVDKKKNVQLVETCKINMLIQCVGCFGLTKDHVVSYDIDDAASDCSVMELDDSIISGDHYFLLKPFLDKYLIEDCLYFYVYLLPDPSLEG